MTPFLRYNITSKIASEKTTESITPNPSVWHPNKWGTTGDTWAWPMPGETTHWNNTLPMPMMKENDGNMGNDFHY